VRRWRREQELEKDRAHDARLGALLSLSFVDYVLERRTGRVFHEGACAMQAQGELLGMAAEPGAQTCAACQQAI
jgi:hypothetical protein